MIRVHGIKRSGRPEDYTVTLKLANEADREWVKNNLVERGFEVGNFYETEGIDGLVDLWVFQCDRQKLVSHFTDDPQFEVMENVQE